MPWERTPTSTPSLPYHTVNASPSSSKTCSSQPSPQAQYLILLSPIVDQKPGVLLQAASEPAITVPAMRPCSSASPQCSTLRWRPADSLYAWAMSPTAKISGALVLIEESVMIPLSTSSPALIASCVRGATPVPKRTVPVLTVSPSSRLTS